MKDEYPKNEFGLKKKYSRKIKDEPPKAAKKKRKVMTPEESYEKVKDRANKLAQERSLIGRDIGRIPPCKHPQLREDCRENLRLFCESYFHELFDIAWSEDHLKAINMMERAAIDGQLFALAMPRGSGKTTLSEIGGLWAMLFGHRKFLFLVGADESGGESLLTSIKSHLEHNEKLLKDFPEVCFPISKLEGEARRVLGQLCKGVRTEMVWKSKEIVFPTIKGSNSSGSIIRIAGMTGKIRGAKYVLADGSSIRPDLVIIDDPQTDESAHSISQCVTRLKVVAKTILGLPAPKTKMAGFMPCTVIREGDVADTILNKDIYPDWQGMRTKMLKSFPTNELLWEKYQEIRAESLKTTGTIKEATLFYKENQAELDEGAEVSWVERYNPDEFSAIQSAMNLKIRDEDAFFSEYQNEPKSLNASDSEIMSAIEISQKLNGFPRYEVPFGCTLITAGMDIQKDILVWTVKAWDENGSGFIIDYGAYPNPKETYWTRAKMKNKSYLDNPDVNGGMEAKLAAALSSLCGHLMDREYFANDNIPMTIDLLLIDANWSKSKQVVYDYIRRSPYGTRIRPSHGRGYQATTAPLSDRKRKEGEKRGENWVLTYPKGTQAGRYVFFDTNFWKSWIHERFQVGIGGHGSCSLWGNEPEEHRIFGDHLTAEHVILVKAKGREVNEWKDNIGKPDNDLLDTVVLCCVAASFRGMKLRNDSMGPAKVKIKKVKKKMSDIMREKQNRRDDW